MVILEEERMANLEKDILFGKAPGRRGRGRSLTRWSNTIRSWMGSVFGAEKEAQNQDRWRELIGAV